MVLFTLRSLPQLGTQSHDCARRSRKWAWRTSPLCTRSTSAILLWKGCISKKSDAISNRTHQPPWQNFEDFGIANPFPKLQTKHFWKGSDRGQSSAAQLHPGHFQGPSHKQLVFLLNLGSCPMKGLAFFHYSSVSIASEGNLCRERRDWHSCYNRANCLRLPHSVKCLLCCFTTQQEAKGQRGLTAEQRPCHSSIHLKPRFWWETTAFQFCPSSSRRQTPDSKLTLQQFFQSGFVC